MENYDKYLPSKELSLYPFQHSGVEFLQVRKRALIASDPGTGKTIQLITAVNVVSVRLLQDKQDGIPVKILVLCPKSMMLTWDREIKKWGVGSNRTVDWRIHNWDRLSIQGGKHLTNIVSQKWDIVIGDESHVCLKNPHAVKCRVFFEKIITNVPYVWIATATPASKSGVDYYCTLKLLLPDLMKQWTETAFKKEFCQEISDRFAYSGKRYEGFKNTHILKDIFKKVAIRHKKAEVLPDLPPKIYTNIEVEVDASIVAENLDLNVGLVIEKILKGEPLPGHLAHVMQANAKAKLDYVVELIDNFPTDKKLVVFAWHRSVIHELIPRIKDRTVAYITGEISSAEERQRIVDSFQTGDLNTLVCNMVSGGQGLTLTAADTAIYVEFPHSPIYLVQSEDRIHRLTQTSSKVSILRVIGKGTVDEAIFAALDKRLKAIEEVGV